MDTKLLEYGKMKLKQYGALHNFFDIDTDLLYIGTEYKVVLKIVVRGETFYYDEPDRWNFRVV